MADETMGDTKRGTGKGVSLVRGVLAGQAWLGPKFKFE